MHLIINKWVNPDEGRIPLEKNYCHGQSFICSKAFTYTGRRQRADPELSLEGSMKGREAAVRNWQM